MGLHPYFPESPYGDLVPVHRWFPADEALREASYERLLPPLVAKIREEVYAWRGALYARASATSAYIFENQWQSFRTRQNRDLELKSAEHTYDAPGRYTIAVKVIDIFGNDTMTLLRVTVG